jgi:L-rhamnose mutarotase
MKRIGFVLKVKKDRLEEYKRHHRDVWPAMREALRRRGWHNYTLFLRDDGLLFGTFETPAGLRDALEGMEKEPINAEWQAMMAPFFEGLDGGPPDQGMAELEEIFHMD